MRPAERSFAVGDQFYTMQDLRCACKEYAIEQNFEFKPSHSDKKRYRIHCVSSEQCPWRLHATLIPVERSGDPKMVEIKAIENEHTCNGVHTLHHRQARASLISSTIQGRVQDHPRYRPSEVVRDARREQGIKISYSTAWRAKEDAVARINGSHEDSYAQLPQYCRHCHFQPWQHCGYRTHRRQSILALVHLLRSLCNWVCTLSSRPWAR